MSAILESVLDPERRASCKRWDALAEPAPATAFDDHVEQFLAKVDVSDVLDALADAEDALSAAIAKGDACAIGRIFLAVRRNYAESCINHIDYAGALRLPGAGEVAAKVIGGVL